ncbi:MAG: 30S ribosomal protein S17 [Acidobacteria bacterium]|nr:MAG: 30S ribosomal protein S17 [Acidobacteriota bacterium]
MSETKRRSGQRKVGVVIGVPGAKTVKVEVESLVQHPMYKRYVRRSRRFLAHDEQERCRPGDKVEIVESRPLSARKRWRVRQIIARGEESARAAGEAGGNGR